jgi:hypothetical protein
MKECECGKTNQSLDGGKVIFLLRSHDFNPRYATYIPCRRLFSDFSHQIPRKKAAIWDMGCGMSSSSSSNDVTPSATWPSISMKLSLECIVRKFRAFDSLLIPQRQTFGFFVFCFLFFVFCFLFFVL